VAEGLELSWQPDASRYTLPRFLEDVAARHGGRPALRFQGSTLRYAELEEQARRLARGLCGAGVGKGARVALCMANRPEWVVSAFAVSLAGAVVVPVNTFATPEERDVVLRHADASLLLLQRHLARRDYLAEIVRDHPELVDGEPGRLRCPALPYLRSVFCLDLDALCGGVQTWDDLLSLGADVPEALLAEMAEEVHPPDEALVIYSSGTTGRPKGIVHAQRAPVIQSWRFAELMDLGPEDRVYTAQPFFWTAGIAMSLGATLAAGGCLLLEETFDPGSALATIEAERATAVHAWPHQEKAMAEHPSARARDLRSVRRIEFSSPLAPLAGLEKDEWGTHGAYGLSETFTIASSLPARAPAELRARTSGRPLPGMELRIVDPATGAPLPPGEEGEIAVRGVTLMRGYAKQAPEEVLDPDGFFRTGDAGRLDADGTLHWRGRLTNLIKTGGANVSPLEIEAAAAGLPGLRAALAVGVPHPTLGEAIVLCALRSRGSATSEADVRRALRQRLAAYKVPRRVLFFAEEELALTGNQKIQVGPLREAALRRLASEGGEIDGHRYGSA
jgi:fatty-acyl-CoA synthase